MAYDVNKLFVQLQNTGLQNKDQPLFQLLSLLIKALSGAQGDITRISSLINNVTDNEVTQTIIQQFILGSDDGGGGDALIVPGPIGPTGASGSAGATGPSGLIGGILANDGEDGNQYPPIIGPQGNPGTTGSQGPIGPVPYPLNGEDGETGFIVLSSGGGSSSPGKLVQVVNFPTGATASGTTVLPFDDTIPQNTEGDEYISLAITPTSAANKLKIEVVIFVTSSGGSNWITAALFQDAVANALASQATFQNLAGGSTPIVFTHYMTAGTTSSTTFKVRAGGLAGTTRINGSGASRVLGGVMSSSITISEIVP